MKRGKKLMAMLLVLVLLAGATVVVTKLNPETEEEEESSTVIFTLDPEAVTAISWDYSEAVAFENTGDGWVYTTDPAFPVEESYLDTMLDTLSEVTASRTIENVEDWDQYCLEVPICTITVTADETYTILIGEETAMGGERYCSIGDGNAYLVDDSVLDSFSYGLYEVLKLESIPYMTGITSMELVSDAQSYEITYQEDSGLAYSDAYVWFLDGQVLDTDLTGELLDVVTDLSWEECADFNVTDFSVFGLEDPAATVTMHYTETVQVATGETDEDGNALYETREDPAVFTLHIGETANGTCYARIGDSHMVYKIDADVLDTLRYTTCAELLPDEVLLMDWEEVTAMDITLNGETHTITKQTQTVTDEDGNETEETVYLLAGAEIDGAEIEAALDNLSFTGYAAGTAPERSEEIRIRIYRDHATFPEVELVLYQYDSSQCLVTLNGESTVFADRTGVVDLVETVNTQLLG